MAVDGLVDANIQEVGKLEVVPDVLRIDPSRVFKTWNDPHGACQKDERQQNCADARDPAASEGRAARLGDAGE